MGSAVTCPEDRPDAQVHSAVLDALQFLRKRSRFVSDAPAVQRGNEIHKIEVKCDQMAVTRKRKGFVDVRSDHQLRRSRNRSGGTDPRCRNEEQDCNGSNYNSEAQGIPHLEYSPEPRTTSIHGGYLPRSTHYQHTCC